MLGQAIVDRIPIDPELRWTVEQEILFTAAQQRAVEQGKPIYSGVTHAGKRIYVDPAGNRFVFASLEAEAKFKKSNWLLWTALGLGAAVLLGIVKIPKLGK